MRRAILLLSLLLGGCVTTDGMWDRSLDSTEPWVLCHNGRAEAAEKITRMLALNQWIVAANNGEVIQTQERKLLKDEDLRGLTWGANNGRLFFVLTDSTVSLDCTMHSAGVEVNTIQGMPLMLKYKSELEKLGFVVTPAGGCAARFAAGGVSPRRE